MKNKKLIITTGGFGFIGVNLILKLLNNKDNFIINLDNETYASNKYLLKIKSNNLKNLKVDISNEKKINDIFKSYKPNCIFNLAAETHVDNSIVNSNKFIKSNILGTYNLLTQSMKNKLHMNPNFKFIHISTDEVYGSLKRSDKKFTEKSLYQPNSPYSASKASSDHLCRAWYETYKFPVIVTNCSNNYGPFQHYEKLIPKIIKNALKNQKIPVYGSGEQIRDWIFVEDHVRALIKINRIGKIGEKYNIGGNNEISNIKLIYKILSKLKKIYKKDFRHLIEFVEDRPGHDIRYAINNAKIKKDLNWQPAMDFNRGLESTINWYIKN